MICLAVYRNESLVCMAGIADASVMGLNVHGGVGDEHPACFHVAGMQDLPAERSAHVYWVEETPLVAGDRLRLTLTRSSESSAPCQVKATDSAQYLQEQAEFEAYKRNYVAPAERAARRWPALEMRLQLKEEPLVRAKLPIGHEHFMCTVQWDQWRPEQCRVFVGSFTGAAQGTQQGTTEWLRGELLEGESFELSVHT